MIVICRGCYLDDFTEDKLYYVYGFNCVNREYKLLNDKQEFKIVPAYAFKPVEDYDRKGENIMEEPFTITAYIDGAFTHKGKCYKVIKEYDTFYVVTGENDIQTTISKYHTYIDTDSLKLSQGEINYIKNDVNSIYGKINAEENTQLAMTNEKFRTSLLNPDLYKKVIHTKDLREVEKVLILAILNEEENRWK